MGASFPLLRMKGTPWAAACSRAMISASMFSNCSVWFTMPAENSMRWNLSSGYWPSMLPPV